MEELIQKAKNGNTYAFTELILNIRNDLYHISKTRLNDDNDINDAIQETMINAYKNIKRLKENSYFKSWIIKILINECNKIYKSKYKNKNIYEKLVNEKIKSNSVNFDIQTVNSNIDFELLIDNLEYEEKLIVTLFYNSDYSCKEISNILNMNINTVKSKLLRAKQKIKNKYKGGIYNG